MFIALTLRNRKAQSTAEYAILIGLVVAAAITIQTYVKRGLQGRVRDAGADLVGSISNADWSNVSETPANVASIGSEAGQFEPGLEDTARLTSRQTQTTLQDDETLRIDDAAGTTTHEVIQRTENEEGDFQRYDAP